LEGSPNHCLRSILFRENSTLEGLFEAQIIRTLRPLSSTEIEVTLCDLDYAMVQVVGNPHEYRTVPAESSGDNLPMEACVGITTLP
jgi:hypothetical protein